MKFLKRPIAPQSLSNYRHGLHLWADFITVETNKSDIWNQINNMQKGLCAYCECKLGNKHVEHFRDRSKHVVLTFSWENIFGSCNNKSRCGHYKDNSKKVGIYNPSEIIKPDEDDPSTYLKFLITGHARIVSNLNQNQQDKARETLRVLNLQKDPALLNSRRKTLISELCLIKEVYELKEDISIEEWLGFIDDEISQLQGREFQTALEHAWKYNESY